MKVSSVLEKECGWFRRATLLCGMACLLVGCADDAAVTPQRDGGPKDLQGDSDGPVATLDGPRDIRAGDLARDSAPDACRPGCHWDCFGGHLCQGGAIYVGIYAPVDCCTENDPWPMAGPVCTDGVIATSCPKGGGCKTGGGLDARYRACIQETRMGLVSGATSEELLRLLCEGFEPKLAGASCVSNADCRPADASVLGALSCDVATTKCVEVARPAAPADYQGDCGLAELTALTDAVESVLPVAGSSTAALCHAIKDASGSCVRQARTYACSFDEDCPSGSVCLCGSFTAGPDSGRGVTFCAAATDRTSVAGRTAGLVCP